MVFQPSILNVSSPPPLPDKQPSPPSQFDVVQSHYPREECNTVEQLLSSTTSNDEIQELLVALLEEVCNLKEALLNPDVLDSKHTTDVEEEKMEMPDERVVEKPSTRNIIQTIDFTGCF
jgi:hypothetical protein